MKPTSDSIKFKESKQQNPLHRIPEQLTIQYITKPSVTATYNNQRKITFLSPPQFENIVVNSIYEASFLIRKRPAAAYNDWKVLNNDYWTVWLYEKKLSELKGNTLNSSPFDSKVNLSSVDPSTFPSPVIHQSDHTVMNISYDNDNSDNNTDTHDGGDNDGGDLSDEKCINIWEIPFNQWTSTNIAQWIHNKGEPPIKLKEISHFRRYDLMKCFEFLCVWDVNAEPHNLIRTWQKWTDLRSHDEYKTYLNKKWDMNIQQTKHFEEETRFQHDEDIDDDIRTFVQDPIYKPDAVGIRAMKKLKKQEELNKKNKNTSRKRKRLKEKENKEDDLFWNAKKDDEDFEMSSAEDSNDTDTDNEKDESDGDNNKGTSHVNVEDEDGANVNLKTNETEEWQEIFEMTSVSGPTPRYRVKVFK